MQLNGKNLEIGKLNLTIYFHSLSGMLSDIASGTTYVYFTWRTSSLYQKWRDNQGLLWLMDGLPKLSILQPCAQQLDLCI